MMQEIIKLREEMWNKIHKILDETEKRIQELQNEEIYPPEREY